MSRTESTMLPIGTMLPAFELPDVVTGRTITASEFSGSKALLIMFICRHCPYVKHVQNELARLGNDYTNRSAGILAISSNDAAGYPEDAPDKLREMATELGFNFPFCYDETQDVARVFTAACTPDFFLFDKNRRLAYRGQLDSSRPGNKIPVTGGDLRSAIEALLNDGRVDAKQIPSIGCNIKWRNR